MQQQKQHRQAQRIVTGGVAAVALLALAALLAALALAGTGSSVYAASRSGGPTLAVTGITGNAITVAGEGWVSGETITLSSSTNNLCASPTPLSITPNNFTLENSNFQVTFTWPSNMSGGTYYLCASGSVSGGPIPAQQPIIVNNNGSVQSTPGSTTTPNATTTSKTSATSTPRGNPASTATTNGTTGNGGNPNPGNKGTSAGSSVSSLVAIILLCLLVLALLVYLIRIWLQGRQARGQNP